MKPRSKRQFLVCQLSEQLPKIAHKLERWAFKNCIDHIGHRNRIWTNCMSCGDLWPTTSMTNKTEVCPGCGWKLRIENTRKQKSKQYARFAKLEIVGEFQVIRYFEIHCHQRSSQKPSTYTREIMQHWLDENGGYEVISVQVGGLGLAYDHFCGGDMTLKNSSNTAKYFTAVDRIYPKMELFPIFQRNGFNSKIKNVSPLVLLLNLPNDSKAETLLKANQFGILSHHFHNRMSTTTTYWPSVKICIRNKYIVKDARLWFDYLDLLKHFGRDLHNSKYVCPKDLAKQHDRLVKKKREQQRKEDLKKQIARAKFDQAAYANDKSKYFGLCFIEGELSVKVLESIQEFIEEGDYHKHCVYTNRYFSKSESLVFSAQLGGERIETVEVCLKTFKVLQSRGLGNKASDHHDRILELVQKNIHQIKRRSAPVKRVKTSTNQSMAA